MMRIIEIVDFDVSKTPQISIHASKHPTAAFWAN